MSSSRIAKNTTYLTLAVVAQKILATVYFIFIARYFANTEVGEYTNAIYLATIFGIFVELGFAAVLTREVAKSPERAQEYLANVSFLKLVAMVITYGSLIGFVHIFDYPLIARQLTVIAGLVMIVDSFNVSFYAVMRGFHNFFYEAVGVIIGQTLLVGFGLFAILGGFPLPFLVVAILISSIFNFFYSAILLYRKFHIRLLPRLQRSTLVFLLKIGAPFLLFGILMRVYGYIDTVLLYRMTSNVDVSYYAAAYKITFALTFVPAAFGSTLYPAFSEYFVTAKDKLVGTFERSMVYLLMICAPIAVGGIVLADVLIPFIYGPNYQPAIPALQILMIALVFIFLGFPVGALLNACNYQKQNTLMMGMTLFFNIAANLILIPLYSYIGAAMAIIISSAVLLFGPLYFVREIVDYNRKFLLMSVMKTVLVASVMGVVVWYLKGFVHFSVLILIGAGVYAGLLYLVKGYSVADLRFLFGSLFPRKNSYEKNTSHNP
ncbi:MAG TPA: flippase [Patescibacteria group bacterium]|nr:flippase [Patescibacteria group bacterium]